MEREVLDVLAQMKQDALITYYHNELSPSEQSTFISHCSQFNLLQSYHTYLSLSTSTSPTSNSLYHDDSYGRVKDKSKGGDTHRKEKGMEKVKEGKVAVIVLAGGMGSRLGVDYPKGIYDVGLPSHKSLFHLQADRIAYYQSMTDYPIYWYIFTSIYTQEATISYFKENKWFGLEEERIIWICQPNEVVMSPEGELLMADRVHLASSPNGNGALYSTLWKYGVIEDMKRKGIEYLYQYCVDNILIQPIDPLVVGYAVEVGAEIVIKTTAKGNPDEKVGLVCVVDGKLRVVEYSESSDEMIHKIDPETNTLYYQDAHLCMNLYHISFLERTKGISAESHLAIKKMDIYDVKDLQIHKKTVYKFEQFIFDWFYLANRFACFEVERSNEFSPLKNKDGDSCTPTTCKRDLLALHRKWLGTDTDMDIEISPSLSVDGSGLPASPLNHVQWIKPQKVGTLG